MLVCYSRLVEKMVNFEAEVADLAGIKEETQDRLSASVVRCKCLGFLLAVLVFRVYDLLLRETRGEVRTTAGSSLYRICSLFCCCPQWLNVTFILCNPVAP